MSRRYRFATPLLVFTVALLAACQSAPPEAPSPSPAIPQEPQPETSVPPAPEQGASTLPEEPAPVPVEIEEPEPSPPPVVVCEPPAPPPPKVVEPQRPVTVLPIFGGVEYVEIEPPGLRLKARLDTGTASSSIDATGIREFERDGKAWLRFLLTDPGSKKQIEVTRPIVRSNSARGGSARRYVVTLHISLGPIAQFAEFYLDDRSGQGYPVTLGRHFLRDQALVDVARRYTASRGKK